MHQNLEPLHRALLEPSGDLLLNMLAKLSLSQPLEARELEALPRLADLGLGQVRPNGFRLNALGHKCADAAREYVLWVGRGRRLHGEGSLPVLEPENFRNKRVLEIGPGWGCNLFRLQEVTPHAVGLEIEEVYARFAPVFAEREGRSTPRIDLGGGERLPYPDGSFDWVVLFTVLQYMDIESAMHEIARVLAPGGRMLSTQALLSTFLGECARVILKTRGIARQSLDLVNCISYQLATKRVFPIGSRASTSRPVYLTRRKLAALARRQGLDFQPALSAQLPWDYIFVAEKPRT